jgi:hypothetical protein
MYLSQEQASPSAGVLFFVGAMAFVAFLIVAVVTIIHELRKLSTSTARMAIDLPELRAQLASIERSLRKTT